MAKKALVLLAPGFETIEALTPIDFLRRAKVEVTVASCCHDDLNIKSAHDVVVKCDVKFESVASQLFDAIIAPGGMPGTTNLAGNAKVVAAIQNHAKEGKIVGAICASPGYVLAEAAKILNGKKACGYPGTDEKITANGGTKLEDEVVIDGNIVTSRGPGTAAKFGLALIKVLLGAEKEQEIGKGVLLL
jgi:4-methyl-5(b-hydroxyethyl)-thiazole monophosphate biosynthesis